MSAQELPPWLTEKLEQLEATIRRNVRRAFWKGVACGFVGAYLGVITGRVW